MSDKVKKEENKQNSVIDAKKSGKGYAGILITCIVIAIILACLIPLFVGGNLWPSNNKKSVESVAEVGNSTVSSTYVDDENSTPTLDDGILNEKLSEGLEVVGKEKTTEHEVVLQGKDLENIEGKASSNTDTTTTVQSTENVDKTQEVEKTEKATNTETEKVDVNAALDAQKITRSNNALHEADIVAKKENQKAQEQEQKKSLETASKSESVKVVDNKKENTIANTNTKVNTSSDVVSDKALASAKKRYTGPKFVIPENVPFTGEAIPGARAEILAKDDSHYTVQVVAASDKQKVIDCSAGLIGRYWIYETRHDNAPWFVLIAGDFADAKEAHNVAVSMPRAIAPAKPFIKTFSRVKEEMKDIL